MEYRIQHDGKAYDPDGVVNELPATTDDTDARNKETERQEIEQIKATKPERLFLYISFGKEETMMPKVTTWLGTAVSTWCEIGPEQKFACFGPFPSIRQSVRCRIFDAVYTGWYFTSSGNYCRLKRSKRQS